MFIKKPRSFLSIILVLVMLLSLFPANTLAAGPLQISRPQDVTVAEGGSAAFTVTAEEYEPPVSYKWEISTDEGDNWNGTTVTEATYYIESTRIDMSGFEFRCVVEDNNESVTSDSATLTVETSHQAQLRKVKKFYTLNKTLTAPFEATALKAAGVDLNEGYIDGTNLSSYSLSYANNNYSIMTASPGVPPGTGNVYFRLNQLILDKIAFGKNPGDLNGENYNYIYALSKAQKGNFAPLFNSGLTYYSISPIMALQGFWGEGYESEYYRKALVDAVLAGYPATSSAVGSSLGTPTNSLWGLYSNYSIINSFWITQSLILCADSSQKGENSFANAISNTLGYMDAEYAKSTSSISGIKSSCELTAAYILTKLAAGQTVDKSAWEELAKFQAADGSYKRKTANTAGNREATAMALLALSQYDSSGSGGSAFSAIAFTDSQKKEALKTVVEHFENDVTELGNSAITLKNLPRTGTNGSTITWTSSNTDWVDNDGNIVIQLANGSRSLKVTMTAMVKKSNISSVNNFNLIIDPEVFFFYPDDELQKLKIYYEGKGELDTALEPVSMLSGTGNLEGFAYDLDYYKAYETSNTPTIQYTAVSKAVIDTIARGGNPRTYTRLKSPASTETETIDLIDELLELQNSDGSFSTYGYVNISNTLALETYFNGSGWGKNEERGGNYGRIGAIRHILGKMQDCEATGGREYFEDPNVNITKAIDSQTTQDNLKYQAEVAILISRWTNDANEYQNGMTVGDRAGTELEGLIKTIKRLLNEDFEFVIDYDADSTYTYGRQIVYYYDNETALKTYKYYQKNEDGSQGAYIEPPTTTTNMYYVTGTDAFARMISALVAAEEKDYITETRLLDRFRNARLENGGYLSAILASDNTAIVDGSTAAAIMALGDYTADRAVLKTLSFDASFVTDSQAVEADLEALYIPAAAYGNLTLKTRGDNGSTITWSSGNEAAIAPDGTVVLPSQGSVTVTLTAVVSRGDESRTGIFSVKVFAKTELTDSQKAQKDIEDISIPRVTIKNISLPQAGANGSIIAWTSQNEAVITQEGIVTRPDFGSADALVTLTATAEINGSIAFRVFTIVIPAVSDIVKEGLYAVREQYNTDIFLTTNYWDIFAAKSVLEEKFDDYGFTFYDVTKHRKTSAWQPTDYGAVILQLLSIDENPYNYKGTDYVQGLLDYYKNNGHWGAYSSPAWAGMALEAAGADMSDEARDWYIGFCKAQTRDLSYGPDMAAWDLIVLANHLNYPGVMDGVNDFKTAMKNSQVKTGDNIALFNTSTQDGMDIDLSTGCVISGFAALKAAGLSGFDLTSDEWKVDGISVFDTLYRHKFEGADKISNQIALEFGDTYYGDSIWRRVGITSGQLDEKIALAEAMLQQTAVYTEESLKTLSSALEAAKAVKNDSAKMSKRAFGKEYFALRDGLDGLIELGSAFITIIGDVNSGIILPGTYLGDASSKSIAAICSDALKNTDYNFELDLASGKIAEMAGLPSGRSSEWYCYVNGVRIDEPLTSATINDGDKLVFKYCTDTSKLPAGATLGQQIAAEEAENLTISGDLSAVTENLILKQQGVFGSVITWESSNTPIVSNDGTVNRYDSADVKVKLTSKITPKAEFGDGSAEKSFEVTVKALNPNPGTPGETGIKVSFTLMGDTVHGEPGTHTSFQTWIPKTQVSVPAASTVYDVFVKVLNQYGLEYVEKATNYVSSIKSPDGYWLGEFDNGPNSGWMYTVNGKHPLLGLREYTLKNGDAIVWHYTDDYTKEEGSEKWNSTPVVVPEPAADTDDTAEVQNDDVPVSMDIKLSAEGNATALVDDKSFAAALDKAKEKAADGTTPVVELKIKVTGGAKSVEVQLSKAALEVLAKNSGVAIRIVSDVSELTFDPAAVAAMANAANQSGDGLSIRAAAVSADDLTDEARAVIRYAPVYELSVSSGNTVISDFEGGSVRVGIPYSPLASQDKNSVIACYIKGTDGFEIIKNSRYDEKTGLVGFTTNHFSRYAVGYNKVSFADIQGKWMQKAVEYMTARNIINGVGESRFDPESRTTRGEFVTILMRALAPDVNTDRVKQFSDVEAGKYYGDWILKAKALGIISGVGDNCFNPDADISREEMFIITYRTLQRLQLLDGYVKKENSTAFTDKKGLSRYAEEAVNALSGYGMVKGEDGKINPKGIATRAECAQFFYNILTAGE